jgi:hypothetical protein
MVEFKRGQTFLDHKAVDFSGNQKAKYFIGLSNAYDPEDEIVCFVMNTENHFSKYHLWCNHGYHRFIIPPTTFTFIVEHTSIMLNKEAVYTLGELMQSDKKLLDIASDDLSRQIKNCIDWRFIIPKRKQLIMNSFK